MVSMSQVIDRFLRYVKIYTTSDENSKTCPSSERQFVLGRLLVEEMQEIGLQDTSMDENGYVIGKLSANTKKHVRPVGFIAHMDTAPSFSGENVNPQLHPDYDGKDILLSPVSGLMLSPKEFPELAQYKGQTIITSDGKTLLGADDKAGIAEILSAMDYLIQHPELEYGEVWVGFTPDEEIGRGADLFPLKKFPADFAFTVDGGAVGEFVYETFNAAGAKVEIQGRSVHPGEAKKKMINSLEVAMQFNQLLPPYAKPEYTEGYDGFIHLMHWEGDVEKTTMSYIIRDHNEDKFKRFKAMFLEARDFINTRYQRNVVSVQLIDQYQNMKEKVEPHRYIFDLVKSAMQKCGIEMFTEPIRGGTDGARLSFMGLPTPNLFTGGHNFHGPYEFIPLESMEKSVELIHTIIQELVNQ
jgi:tripeptide aminopeptidase